MITSEHVDRLIGAVAMDAEDDRIGEVSQVYLDAESERPTWVSVRLGLLSGTEVLVPLDGAEWDDRALHTTVTREAAKEAPRVEQDEPLTMLEQERLYTHYGIPSERHPRLDVDLDVDPDEVRYSVRDDEPVQEAPATASAHDLGSEPDRAREFSRAS